MASRPIGSLATNLRGYILRIDELLTNQVSGFIRTKMAAFTIRELVVALRSSSKVIQTLKFCLMLRN